MKHSLPLIYLLCTFLMMSCSLLHAQHAAPGNDLLVKAQQAVAAAQWDEVVTSVESLRQQYPLSPLLPEGMILLYQAYLEQQLSEQATTLGKEMVNRWPRSNYVWRVVQITCEYKAKVSPADAVDALDRALQGNMLAPADRVKARNLRFSYLQDAKSDRFLTEALAKINALRIPVPQTEMLLAAGLAAKVYPDLMAAGRFDEAKAISTKIQELLAQTGNPQNGLFTDRQAYMNALKAADMQRFTAEALIIFKQIDLAETAPEVAYAAGIALTLYPALLKSLPYEDVKALHAKIEKALLHSTLAKLAQDDTTKWVDAVSRAYPDRALPEIQESLQRSLTAQSAEEFLMPVEMIAKVYKSYFSQKKLEEAQALHTRVQAVLQQCALTDKAFLDTAQYTCEYVMAMRTTDMGRYLVDGPQQLRAIIEHATSLAILYQVSEVLGGKPGLYLDLFLAGRTDEAQALYAQMQAALVRVSRQAPTTTNPTLVARAARQNLSMQVSNTKDYLIAFGQSDPEGFVSAFLPVVEKAAAGGSAEEIKMLVAVMHVSYQALLEAGGTEAATRIHTELQALMQRLPTLKLLAQAEQGDYFTALSIADPTAFITEIKLVLAKLAEIDNVDAALQIAPLVQLAYAPLNQSGCFQDARTAHDQLQVLLTKFDKPEEAKADKKKYQDNLSIQALEGMLQLFKKSLVVPNMPAAKKWLDELNAIAPESPQAIRARALWKEYGGQ